MSRGAQDYAIYPIKSVGASLSDMADLAVRMGSIVEYDRRGDVICLDDFEDPVLKWTPGGLANGYVRLDSTSVKSGAQAVRLHNNAVLAAFVHIIKDLFPLASQRLGAEFSFANPAGTYTIKLRHFWYDGTNFHWAEIRFNNTTRNLELIGDGAGVQLIAAGIILPVINHCYIPIKLVCDFENDRYVRLLFAGEEYDVSAFAIRTGLDGRAPQSQVVIGIDNGVGVLAGDLWVDNFVWTENEP